MQDTPAFCHLKLFYILTSIPVISVYPTTPAISCHISHHTKQQRCNHIYTIIIATASSTTIISPATAIIASAPAIISATITLATTITPAAIAVSATTSSTASAIITATFVHHSTPYTVYEKNSLMINNNIVLRKN